MTEDGLPPLRDVINTHDLRAKKNFGQNFLLDLNLTRRIARIPGDLSNSHIYEVGPGPGGLTRAILMEGAKSLLSVEMDARCLPALEEIQSAYRGRFHILEGDALEVDEPEAIRAETGPRRVVANLPYNVGTLLFIKWLTLDNWMPWYDSLTLMFQKEVADRIVAVPGTKAYGRLSVLAQWRGRVRIALKVPAAAFTPPPKVMSAVIHFEPTDPIDPDVHLKYLERVVAQAFQQRRKMLRASLKGLGVDPITLCETADIDPTTRADALSVKGYVRLARALQYTATP